MNSNGVTDRHLRTVGVHAFVDAVIFLFAAIVGLLASPHITGSDFGDKFVGSYPAMAVGVSSFLLVSYVFGFYHPSGQRKRQFAKFVMIGIALAVTGAAIIGVGYVHHASRFDRYPMLVAMSILAIGAGFHHLWLVHVFSSRRDRLVMIVSCRADEEDSANIRRICGDSLEFVGIVTTQGYTCQNTDLRVLGTIHDLTAITERHLVDRVVCTQRGINSRNLYSLYNKLRYSGTSVQTMLCLYEELHQCCPVALVTPEWLLNASGSPHMFYIRKFKRAFDIVAALVGLIVLGPIMLVGMLAVRLTSRGPIFYRQVRSGRFGQDFKVIKLRSMRVDAEAGTGAVWSSGKSDSRVTPVGGFLRKYRIDEIPQLLNVLRGEMSFVGPRPERPEFITKLEDEIPYFGERLLVQPGITGWAQVCFPYGSTVEDARRKLEYDLYYMKNMSLLMDLVIILDTVRIVLVGGLDREKEDQVPEYKPVEQPMAIGADELDGIPELSTTPAVTS